MPFRAVSPTRAHEAMVSMSVRQVVAVWAMVGLSENWYTKLSLNHDFVVERLNVFVKCFVRMYATCDCVLM